MEQETYLPSRNFGRQASHKKSILITGASGYLGHALAKELLKKGEQVHALYRSSIPNDLKEFPNLTLCQGDLSDVSKLAKYMSNCSQVYHIAAYSTNWAPNMSVFHTTNVIGTKNMLEAAVEAGIKKFVYTSSAGTLGPQINNNPVTEKTQRKVAPFNLYEKTKIQAEKLVQDYVEKGNHAVIVHPTRLFGPGIMGGGNFGTELINKYISGNWKAIPGNGKSIGNWGYIEDVVKGHILAMEKGKTGEHYLLGGENHDFNQFFSTLKKESGKDYKLYKAPMWIMLTAAGFIKTISSVFGTKPKILPSDVRKYSYHWATSLNKAKEELGYSITPFNEAIKKTVNWLENR